MFDWLFEGKLAVYVLLGAVAAAILALWWQRRDRGYLYAFAGVAGVALVYFLLDLVRETPRAKARHALEDMADAVNKRDVKRLLGHFSTAVRFQGRDKEAFRGRVGGALDAFEVRNARPIDVRFLKVDLDAGTMTVRFTAQADNNSGWRTLPCEADLQEAHVDGAGVA